jgi:hypothetical protein
MLKKISKKLLQILSISTIIIVSNSCSGFGRKEPKAIENYCHQYLALKESEEIKKDILTISNQLFEYIAVNEMTFNCVCLAKNQVACFEDYNKMKV